MTERSPLPSEHEPTATGAAVDPAGSITALVQAGLPLEAGLRALSEEVPSRRMRHILRKMSRELAQGQSPDEVLAHPHRGLPNYLRGLVQAGVRTGQLGAFLEQFLLSLRRRRAAARSFWGMMAYPLILLPLAAMVGTILVFWIVPRFKDIVNEFGVELPQFTITLIKVINSPVVLGILTGTPLFVLLVILMIVLGRFLPGHALRLRLFQKIPLIGTPSRMRGLSEFCSLLGLLVSGRLPLPEALRKTASALHDANLRQGARRLASRVEQGESLEQSAHALPQFSRELVNLFRWEHRGDAFGDILLRAGEVYSSRTHVHVGLTVLIIQPLIFFGTAFFLGFVVLALFMPLIKLLNELS